MEKKVWAIALIVVLGICGLLGMLARSNITQQQISAFPRWNYGEQGPQWWGQLDIAFQQCAIGQAQSPLNLSRSLAALLLPEQPIQWHYRPSFGIIQDLGTTLQIRPAGENYFQFGSDIYALQQIHFHHPSEHLIEGQAYAMEVHLVHQNSTGATAVVAVLVKTDMANGTFTHLLQRFPRPFPHPGTIVALDVADFLPKQPDNHMSYWGSLTTPPCTENVRWIVLSEPITFAPEQIAAYQNYYLPNARPVQIRPVPLEEQAIADPLSKQL